MERGGGDVRGDRLGRPWRLLKAVLGAVDWTRHLRGVYWRGVRNALDIRLRRIDLAFPGLPAAFEGYTILHLTDPHFDTLEETAGRLVALVAGLEVDACAWTGDYGDSRGGDLDNILVPLARVMAAVTVRDGAYAVLGNHDGGRLVAPFERLGLRVLINETIVLERDGARIHLTGLDDVHYFHTDDAHEALRAAPDGFGIALVHSPEAADDAAGAGFALYLTGHTHAGQVCLPGGRPIVTNLRRNRALASGLWRRGGMTGYTSPGIGVSLLPVRFNSRGEATLITLRRAD